LNTAKEEPIMQIEMEMHSGYGDLGQKEAGREKASEDQLRRMRCGPTSGPYV
jgi:hypothetical protein